MKKAVLTVVVLVMLAPLASAAIYSEDFSTDPFASRWTKTSSAGYPLYWTGTNPSSINTPLPAEVGNPLDALYAFSTGIKEAWTTDVTEQTVSYTVAYDFMINTGGDPCASIADNSFGQYVQRQANNSAYQAAFAIGGNGQTRWIGDYYQGVIYGGDPLVHGTWYKLVTDVTITASDVSMQSQIVRLSDNHIMRASQVFTDSSETRYTTSKGYGLRIGCPGTHYWNQALQVDNFEVVPEPMTVILLTAGSLLLRRRHA